MSPVPDPKEKDLTVNPVVAPLGDDWKLCRDKQLYLAQSVFGLRGFLG